ncbi:MAG: leucine-rich repeat domain-containing protein [Muribaculaceae bacterium]|nr:leucine-rich repeat domain-containing protein [Muribaculaceae bacterium]
MKKFILVAGVVLFGLIFTGRVFANEDYKRWQTDVSAESMVPDFETHKPHRFLMKSAPKAADEELVSLSVKTTKEGELEALIGDKLLDIEKLSVAGPINADDFTTMWRASLYGLLRYLDLKNAALANGEVPNDAFYNWEEQYDEENNVLYVPQLTKMILPDNVKSIGNYGFQYAIYLESINIPSSLRKIGKRSFSHCYALNFDVLSLPEGIESVENGTFYACRSFKGKVQLPSTVKTIERAAFWGSNITTITLPDGLQTIGDGAFYDSGLQEVYVPDGCLFEGDGQFGNCPKLKRARLPEGLTVIPDGLFDGCSTLEELIVPEGVTEIKQYAFSFCYDLRKLVLPTTLINSSFYSFFYLSSLEEIHFPATMEVIGEQSCKYWRNIKRIYCAATTPPLCVGEEKEPLQTPFGVVTFDPELQTPRDTPVYVPRGSADAYRNAWGWNYFTNFIETDEFPASGVDEILTDEDWENMPMYDLYGRKISEPQKGQIYIKGGKKFMQN